MLSLIGPNSVDIYPQDILTFNVFSSSGHTEDTFLGQACVELNREMFYGLPSMYKLDLHHAYQPIYLDENSTADHIADLKDEPQGKLRVVVQVLPIATLNLASRFVDIKHNLFTGVYFNEVWAILKEGILYLYPSNYTQSDSYLKKVDCRLLHVSTS